jgi:hypothetical protein
MSRTNLSSTPKVFWGAIDIDIFGQRMLCFYDQKPYLCENETSIQEYDCDSEYISREAFEKKFNINPDILDLWVHQSDPFKFEVTMNMKIIDE